MGRRHDLPAPPPLDRSKEYIPEVEGQSRGRHGRRPGKKLNARNWAPIPKTGEGYRKVTEKKQQGFNTPFKDIKSRQETRKHITTQIRYWLDSRPFTPPYWTEQHAKAIARVVGLSREEFIEHLESGGLKRGPGVNMDHIIPVRLADNSPEMHTLFHYANLQLLTEQDNHEKSGRLPTNAELHPNTSNGCLKILERGRKQ